MPSAMNPKNKLVRIFMETSGSNSMQRSRLHTNRGRKEEFTGSDEMGVKGFSDGPFARRTVRENGEWALLAPIVGIALVGPVHGEIRG
jgi:hypothetical protein